MAQRACQRHGWLNCVHSHEQGIAREPRPLCRRRTSRVASALTRTTSSREESTSCQAVELPRQPRAEAPRDRGRRNDARRRRLCQIDGSATSVRGFGTGIAVSLIASSGQRSTLCAARDHQEIVRASWWRLRIVDTSAQIAETRGSRRRSAPRMRTPPLARPIHLAVPSPSRIRAKPIGRREPQFRGLARRSHTLRNERTAPVPERITAPGAVRIASRLGAMKRTRGTRSSNASRATDVGPASGSCSRRTSETLSGRLRRARRTS